MGGWKYEDFIKAFDRPGAKYLDEAPIEFIKRYAKEYADLQNSELKAEIERWKGAYSDEISKVKESNRLNRELQKVVDAAREVIGKNMTRPEVYEGRDTSKYKLAVALQSLTEKRFSAAEIKDCLTLIENGKCPECGGGVHIHDCTKKRVGTRPFCAGCAKGDHLAHIAGPGLPECDCNCWAGFPG